MSGPVVTRYDLVPVGSVALWRDGTLWVSGRVVKDEPDGTTVAYGDVPEKKFPHDHFGPRTDHFIAWRQGLTTDAGLLDRTWPDRASAMKDAVSRLSQEK